MKARKPMLLIAAVVALGGLMTTVCGPAYASSVEAGPSSHTVAVSMFGAQPGNVINLKTNWFTKYAERTFGLKFTFDLVPGADVATKQPLLLASGSYPDIIWNGSISQEDALNYGSQGVFRPLNGLIKKYAPNVWHTLQTVAGYKQAAMAPNGKIYALPSYNYCQYCAYSEKFYINVKYLNEYHLNMPRTTAQFEHVLEVFKAHGLVPLDSSPDMWNGDPVTFLMNAFIPFNGLLNGGTYYLDVKNGRVSFTPAQPQYRAGLAYLHDLFKKGLLPKVDFSQQANEVEQLIAKQKVGVVPAGAGDAVVNDYGSPGSHYQDWLAIPPLKGPAGVQSVAVIGNGTGGLTFAITNKATRSQEIRIMRLLNFMYTPRGAQIEDFGREGVYWTAAKKGQGGLAPGQALFADDWTHFTGNNDLQNQSWYQWGPYDESATWRNRTYAPAPFGPTGNTGSSQVMTEATEAGHQPPEVYPPSAWVPKADTQQYATEQTNIDNYVSQWTDEFITGEKSTATEWKSYLAGLAGLNLKNYLHLAQKAMGTPEHTNFSELKPEPADVKYLLSEAPVPALMKKYLLQSGVPASDFGH